MISMTSPLLHKTRENFEKTILVAEFLNFGVADFVITLVGIGTLTLGDFASLNILLDEFCDLKFCLIFFVFFGF